MFQHAIGRSIAEKHGRTLFLDDLALRIDHPGRTRRAYALGAFNIEAELTSRAGSRAAGSGPLICKGTARRISLSDPPIVDRS